MMTEKKLTPQLNDSEWIEGRAAAVHARIAKFLGEGPESQALAA
jgi:hypothetical protein